MTFARMVSGGITALAVLISGCGILGGAVPSGGGGGGNADMLLLNAAFAVGRADKAVMALGGAAMSKKEVDEHNAKIEAINKIADPQEKEAKLQAEKEAYQATVVKRLETDAAKIEAAAADATKKAQLARALQNLIFLTFYDNNLIGQITAMVSRPNPAIVGQLRQLKYSAELIGKQVKLIGAALPHIKTLATKVGVTTFPASAAEDPGEVDLGS